MKFYALIKEKTKKIITISFPPKKTHSVYDAVARPKGSTQREKIFTMSPHTPHARCDTSTQSHRHIPLHFSFFSQSWTPRVEALAWTGL